MNLTLAQANEIATNSLINYKKELTELIVVMKNIEHKVTAIPPNFTELVVSGVSKSQTHSGKTVASILLLVSAGVGFHSVLDGLWKLKSKKWPRFIKQDAKEKAETQIAADFEQCISAIAGKLHRKLMSYPDKVLTKYVVKSFLPVTNSLSSDNKSTYVDEIVELAIKVFDGTLQLRSKDGSPVKLSFRGNNPCVTAVSTAKSKFLNAESKRVEALEELESRLEDQGFCENIRSGFKYIMSQFDIEDSMVTFVIGAVIFMLAYQPQALVISGLSY
ncbi:hypothetical protein JCM33374_g5323 [Metschnikowia sp. JCM 33374]|nr:hypothetical protein JCM33374_g5323 [Metschnikowia sp. JCM 33374]